MKKIGCIFAIILVIFGMLRFTNTPKEEGNLVSVKATVISVDSYERYRKFDSSTTNYRINVEYEYEGQKYEDTIEDIYHKDIEASELKTGDIISLQIDPEKAYTIYSTKKSNEVGIVCIAIGVYILVMFLKDIIKNKEK